MLMEIVEALENVNEVSEDTENVDSNDHEIPEADMLDDNGNPYRTEDGGWIPNNTYELDGTEYKTDDHGHIYQHDGEYYPDDFFVIDGELYITDSDGNVITDDTTKAVDSQEEDSSDAPENEDESSKELTQEEINELQQAAIKEAFDKIARGEELTNAEKGNLCEMMMDQYYISKGYTPLHDRVTSLDDPGHHGIDGVYEKQNEDGSKEYIIADAKYDSSKLGTTTDGKQLSDTWIYARLDDAVGKEKADEIRDAYEDNPDSVQRVVYHYAPTKDAEGNTYSDIFEVDADGMQCSDKTVVEIFDEKGVPTPLYED